MGGGGREGNTQKWTLTRCVTLSSAAPISTEFRLSLSRKAATRAMLRPKSIGIEIGVAGESDTGAILHVEYSGLR